MKRLASLTLALSLSFSSSAVLALPVRTVFADKLQGMVLKVWSGHDLPIDFIPSGEVVTGAVIGYPSIVLGGMAGTLCPRISETDCTDTGAPVIYLRQTKLALRQPKLDNSDFPLLPSSDGSTSLTLTTVGPQGNKNYILTVVPAQGRPEYAGLQIQPPSQKQTPILPLTPVRQAPSVPVIDRIPTITSSVERQRKPKVPNQKQANNQNTVIARVQPTITRSNSRSSRQGQELPNKSPSVNQPLTATSQPPAIATTQKKAPNLVNSPSSVAVQPTSNLNTSAVHAKPSTSQLSVGTRAVKPQSTASNLPTQKPVILTTQPKKFLSSVEAANALVRGLVVARQKRQIGYKSKMWRRVQSAVVLLRRGNTKQQAAQRAEVPLKVIDQLLTWGQVSTFSSATSSSNSGRAGQ